MLQDLRNAYWEHSKKKASLIYEDTVIIEMEFKRKVAIVKIAKKKLEFKRKGVWCPKILISENDKVVALQKQLGLWGTKSEVNLDDKNYIVTTRQGVLFNISYSNTQGEILTYKLDAFKNKPVIKYEIKSVTIPEKHFIILLALGFYSIKNVAIEALSNDFIVTAVA